MNDFGLFEEFLDDFLAVFEKIYSSSNKKKGGSRRKRGGGSGASMNNMMNKMYEEMMK